MARKRIAPPSETDWRAHEDMHTLRRAAEIAADPRRHKAAQAEARRHVAALEAVVGPRRRRLSGAASRRKRLENVEL